MMKGSSPIEPAASMLAYFCMVDPCHARVALMTHEGSRSQGGSSALLGSQVCAHADIATHAWLLYFCGTSHLDAFTNSIKPLNICRGSQYNDKGPRCSRDGNTWSSASSPTNVAAMLHCCRSIIRARVCCLYAFSTLGKTCNAHVSIT